MNPEGFGQEKKGNGGAGGAFGGQTPREPQPNSLAGMLDHLHEDVVHGHAMISYNRFLLFCIGVTVAVNFAGLWLYLALR